MRFLAFIWPTLAVLNQRIFPALRLSVLPVLTALGLWIVARSYALPDGTRALGVLAWVFGMILLMSICYAWFAIRWHRYLLLGEAQTALGGTFPPRCLRRYALRLFSLFAPMLLAAFVLSVLTDPFGSMGLGMQWLRYVVMYTALGWVFYRLSPALASVPLGDPLTRGDAWRATRGKDVECLGLSFGTLVITTLLQLPMTPNGAPLTAWEPLYLTVSFWVQVLLFTTAVSVVYRQAVMKPALRQ